MALSRVRGLEGLEVLGPLAAGKMTSSEVVKRFYAALLRGEAYEDSEWRTWSGCNHEGEDVEEGSDSDGGGGGGSAGGGGGSGVDGGGVGSPGGGLPALRGDQCSWCRHSGHFIPNCPDRIERGAQERIGAAAAAGPAAGEVGSQLRLLTQPSPVPLTAAVVP